jgi:hypothetical protein
MSQPEVWWMEPAPCGYLPHTGWLHPYALDGHRDACGKCAAVEALKEIGDRDGGPNDYDCIKD